MTIQNCEEVAQRVGLSPSNLSQMETNWEFDATLGLGFLF